jgi:hypothetical protein
VTLCPTAIASEMDSIRGHDSSSGPTVAITADVEDPSSSTTTPDRATSTIVPDTTSPT